MYEYKVIPAPVRGLKAKGVKTPEDRFAHALQTAINTLAADGWEYVRADTLPCEQREGLMGKTTTYQNMLVFRRERAEEPLALQPPKQVRAPKVVPVLEDTPVEPPFQSERARESAEAEAPDPEVPKQSSTD